MARHLSQRRMAAYFCAIIVAWPVLASANESTSSSEPDADFQNARRFELALFAPSAPGFVVLGLSPRRQADPGSFRTYGFDVANLTSGDRYEFGGALSFEPFWWGHQDLTLRRYQQDTTALERVLARTQLSLAASYLSGNTSQYYSIGIGVQAQLLDVQDERYDAHSHDCLLQAWQTIRRSAHQSADDAVFDYLATHPDASEAELKTVRDAALSQGGTPSASAFESARNDCRDAASLASLGKPSLMVGFGGKLRTADASFRSPGADGGSLWAAYRQPLAEDGLVSLELFGRYTFSGTLNVLENGPASEAKGNEAAVGAGMALERLRWKVDAAVSYLSQDFRSAALGTQCHYEATLSGAIRIHEGLWLQAYGGDTFGGRNTGKPFLGLNIKYDWSELSS